MPDKSVEEILGLTVAAVSPAVPKKAPENEFYDYMSKGASPRIDNLVYELKHSVLQWEYLQQAGIVLAKIKFELTNGSNSYMTLSLREYVQVMVEYYLQTRHASRFLPDTLLDFAVTVRLFMEHPDIKRLYQDTDLA